jgi:hypothetical protein
MTMVKKFMGTYRHNAVSHVLKAVLLLDGQHLDKDVSLDDDAPIKNDIFLIRNIAFIAISRRKGHLHVRFQCNYVARNQCYKTFYGRKLPISVISQCLLLASLSRIVWCLRICQEPAQVKHFSCAPL